MTYREFAARYPDHAEELEERAAIMEYCGSMPRHRAEAMATGYMKKKYKLWFQAGLFGGEDEEKLDTDYSRSEKPAWLG